MQPDPPDPPEELELLARQQRPRRPLAGLVVALALAWGLALAPIGVSVANAATDPAPTISVPSNGVVARDANGALLLQGTASPGDYLQVLTATTRAGINQELSNFEAKFNAVLSTCPPLDFGDCTDRSQRADASGRWAFPVPIGAVKDGTTIWAQVASHPEQGLTPWHPELQPVELIVGAMQVPSTAANPSVFSDLAAFNWQTLTPTHVTITAGAALVLTLLLGFPTTLLNSALDSSYEERTRRLAPVTEPIVRLARRTGARWKQATVNIPRPVSVVCWFLLAAIISGFADPSFGFTLESLRLLVSLFVAFGLLNVLGAYVTWWITREDEHTPRPRFPSKPTNLVILALTVLVARLIHLEPTLVFGTVLGVDMGAQLVLSKKARVILVGVAYSAGIGILAWLIYSLVPAGWTGFAAVTVRELFSQLAIAGIATLPITLLPFRALQGETLWKWQRIYWGLFYAAGMLLFLLILLPMPFSWGEVSEPLVAWILIFVVYSAIAILGWLAVRYAWISSAEKWVKAQRAARATPVTASPPANKVDG